MLIGLQNVTFEFGARAIVTDATWHIQPGERIGLIGYNGTGKSTLLKLLVGQYTPSKGTVEKGRDTTIGYLHQDLLSFDTSETITEVALGAFERVRELEKEIEALGIELEANPEDNDILIKYTDALHEIDVLDGYNIEHKAEEVLHGLGFTNKDLNRPYKEFSGGWRMRVLLAKMILQAPDVLLLDEPTNHLDLPSIEWLEKYLLHYKGSVVIVSHDKFFLNKMVNKIVEVYQQQLNFYTGDYEYYEVEKVQRVEIQQRAFENQQDYIRQQERFIERFKAKASKAAQAQSIQKRLDRLDVIEDVQIERPNIRINFAVDKTPGKVLVDLKGISKSYPTLTILENAFAEIERGDKIALIGANGKGKSTLLRIVAGMESYDGERVWGHNVDESFYAQHQLESLNLNNTILQEVQECGTKKTDLELRALLGCFLFGGDEIDKKIKVLSGGEKARVALTKTIISKANFLMLDEPTNHLDMATVELLAEALTKYDGSIILVSHDRYFISKTANKIWEIEDEKIIEFKGDYAEWVAWKERMAKQKAANPETAKPTPKPVEKKVEPVAAEVKTGPIDKELQKQIQKLQKAIAQLEQNINQLNQEKTAIELKMADPSTYTDPAAFQVIEKSYHDKQALIRSMNKEYEMAFNDLVALESK
ncbi:MAG: ABC-F family ATP-binding cassette domain-containing protein [Sediminibacterium sp.]|nr:ABC-F family ATP-binding cassette domain-containing protein [Sediminibacterium sp.]MBP6145221.1 ABC-F family ATP-binding cassette domain-containing protein [Sediminibacterium sp.]